MTAVRRLDLEAPLLSEARNLEYRLIPSLQAYVAVHRKQRRVEAWLRDGLDWRELVLMREADALALAGPSLALPLSEIYEAERFPVG